jgi:hypothetical protein
MKGKKRNKLLPLEDATIQIADTDLGRLVAAVYSEIAVLGIFGQREREAEATTELRTFLNRIKQRRRVNGETGPWSEPKPPSEWSRLYGMGWDTLKKRFESQTIRNKKDSSKSYRVHVSDLPANLRI